MFILIYISFFTLFYVHPPNFLFTLELHSNRRKLHVEILLTWLIVLIKKFIRFLLFKSVSDSISIYFEMLWRLSGWIKGLGFETHYRFVTTTIDLNDGIWEITIYYY